MESRDCKINRFVINGLFALLSFCIYIWLLKQWLTSTLNKNQTLQSSTENDGWAISIPLAEFYLKKKAFSKQYKLFLIYK